LRLTITEPISLKVYTGLKYEIDPNVDTLVRPYPLNRNVDLMDKLLTCGANNFYFEDRTIEFVLTRYKDCMVHIWKTNSV